MQIKRNIIEVFRQWKEAADRKPILLKGARQIGKTWAIETFGKESYEYCVKFDFDRWKSRLRLPPEGELR